jgi:long-chain acyl-CoA synthetase
MPDILAGRVISGQREIAREVLFGRALRAAGGFAALGVQPGDTVVLVLRNDFTFFEASYAAQMLGAYCVPVNWHGKAPEIGYVLRDCAAKIVVAHVDLLPQVLPVLPDGVTLLAVPTPPEIAAAYDIPADQSRAPAGTTIWDEMARRLHAAGQSGRGRHFEHDLHLRHDWQSEGREAAQSRAGVHAARRSGRPRGAWF